MTAILKRKSVFVAVLLASLARGELSAKRSNGPEPPTVMSGDYSAIVITRFLDKELVKSWLPKGLILDADCPFQQQHPVIIMAGEQRRFARTRDLTLYPLWGWYYDEVFISIPYLKMAKFPEKPPVHHFVRVYLNNWKGTYLGVERGWAKLMVPVSSRPRHGSYRVWGTDDHVMFHSQTNYACQQCISPCNVSFQQIRKMLEMPMVLQKPCGKPGFKPVDFDFHFECAQVHSVPTNVCISECFMPNFPRVSERIPGINQMDYGAFHMTAHFTARKLKY